MRLKIAGFALMGILAMLIIPANSDSSKNEPGFYGAATMVHKNPVGEELFSQTVHNRLLDVGELYLLNQTFQEPTSLALADNIQIGSICLSTSSTALVEGLTATTFDANDGIAPGGFKNCKQDESVQVFPASSTAQVGPLQFQCDNINCANGFQVNSIGICQNRAVNSTDYWECAQGGLLSNGILFASVIVTPTTLNSGETVDITYTFDISSAGT